MCHKEALGGRVMTRTCRRCNNDLGARVEAELQDWFDRALTKVRMSHDGEIPGKRRLPTIYYLEEKGSKRFALNPAGELTPEVIQMMESGTFWLNYREPDPRRWRLALLKHAYLAACLYRGDVPESADAQAIRGDLIAARDTPSRASLPESEAASRLKVYRSGVGRQGSPLSLVARVHPQDASADPEVLISLAGVLFVSWPFTDLPAGTWQRQAIEGDH
ncbi:hypothetical protein [Microlunatus sp. GCM10028923]|uniref:hypothetical protein n=1 Tax=Microlunatus sp. GCM10028923 TaxID=3273400 RepID=UPI00360A34B9